MNIVIYNLIHWKSLPSIKSLTHPSHFHNYSVIQINVHRKTTLHRDDAEHVSRVTLRMHQYKHAYMWDKHFCNTCGYLILNLYDRTAWIQLHQKDFRYIHKIKRLRVRNFVSQTDKSPFAQKTKAIENPLWCKSVLIKH